MFSHLLIIYVRHMKFTDGVLEFIIIYRTQVLFYHSCTKYKYLALLYYLVIYLSTIQTPH